MAYTIVLRKFVVEQNLCNFKSKSVQLFLTKKEHFGLKTHTFGFKHLKI
jgi:hypothetical protein